MPNAEQLAKLLTVLCISIVGASSSVACCQGAPEALCFLGKGLLSVLSSHFCCFGFLTEFPFQPTGANLFMIRAFCSTVRIGKSLYSIQTDIFNEFSHTESHYEINSKATSCAIASLFPEAQPCP